MLCRTGKNDCHLFRDGQVAPAEYDWVRQVLPLAGLACLAGLVGLAWLLGGRPAGAIAPWLEVLASFLPLQVLGAGVMVVGAAWLAPGGWRAGLQLRSGPRLGAGGALGLGLVVAAGFYPFSLVMTGLAVLTLRWVGVEVLPSPLFDHLIDGDLPVAGLTVFGALVLAPLAEEILFRLGLYEFLRGLRLPLPALLVAVVFAAVHGQAHALPALICLSLVLQAGRWLGGTLWLPIGIHAGFNLISVAIYMLFNSCLGR